MKRNKQIRQIVTKPSQKKHPLLRKATLDVKPRIKAGVGLEQRREFRDFNFEEEAARLAHLNGWDELPRLRDEETELEQELETEEEAVENHDDHVSRYEDDRIIEKLHRNHKSEEKEGWEAFYG
jgi:predicted  nucleic acid-binding Zn-ribbon protein